MIKALRCVSLSLVLLFLLSFSVLFVFADANEMPYPTESTDGKAVGVYDVTHRKFIYQKNAHEQVNTSTSAKIMTGLIACELLEDRLDEKITLTQKMIAGAVGYSMKLCEGEVISVRDLLYGAICGSYNDAALTVAVVCSGSVESFVSLMNLRAKELGAGYTAYTNPLGYPDNTAMVTTLSDTVKIAEAAYHNKLYMEICSAVSHRVSATNTSPARSFYNRNLLISSGYQYDYFNKKCSGMNAGISGEAGGWSVVTVAHDDGADLICAVLGGTEDGSEIYAYKTVNYLVDWACREYQSTTVFKAGEDIGTVDVGLTGMGTQKAVYVATEDIAVYMPSATHSSLSYHLELTDPSGLKAPLIKGNVIGTVNIYDNGVLICSSPVAIKESYEQNAVMSVIDVIASYTKSRAFITTLVCFAILMPTALVIVSRRSRNHTGFKRRR